MYVRVCMYACVCVYACMCVCVHRFHVHARRLMLLHPCARLFVPPPHPGSFPLDFLHHDDVSAELRTVLERLIRVDPQHRYAVRACVRACVRVRVCVCVGSCCCRRAGRTLFTLWFVLTPFHPCTMPDPLHHNCCGTRGYGAHCTRVCVDTCSPSRHFASSPNLPSVRLCVHVRVCE